MTEDQLQVIRDTVHWANNAGYDYDQNVKIIDETPDHVKVRLLSDDEGDEDDENGGVTALVRVLGDYTYEDAEHTLLGVWIDQDRHGWRVIDARGTSLFAVLYVC